MKLILFLILGMFLLSFVNAEVESLGTFRKNDCANLIQTCGNCSYINISSVTYPNSTQAIGQVAMTKIGTKYNYNFCNTTDLGTYIVNGFGDVDGVVTVFAYDFEVTETGTKFTTGQGILYTVFMVIGIFIFLLCLAGAIQIPYGNNKSEEGTIIGLNDLKYVKIILWVFSYLILLFIVGLSRGITFNFISDVGVYKLFNWMYWIMFSFMYPLIICSFIFALISFVNDKKIQKALQRGVPFR